MEWCICLYAVYLYVFFTVLQERHKIKYWKEWVNSRIAKHAEQINIDDFIKVKSIWQKIIFPIDISAAWPNVLSLVFWNKLWMVI